MFANFDWIGTILRSPVSLVLIGCSVVTLGVAIERFVYYWKRRGDPNATLALMLQRIREGKVQEAAFVCRSCQHPFGAVAAPLFEGGNESASGTAMEERMLIALSEQKLALERGLAILGTMAAAGPLIGLLGTVWGIMGPRFVAILEGAAGIVGLSCSAKDVAGLGRSRARERSPCR